MLPNCSTESLRRTTVTILTAPGRSAIAVVAIDGPAAVQAIDRYFQPATGKPVGSQVIGRVLYGNWLARGAGGSSNSGEGVVVRRVNADRWEVHPHGGTAAVRAIVDDLVAGGCIETSWQTDCMQQSADPIAAAATLALTKASTERTAAHLLAQQRGALRHALNGIVSQIEAGQIAAATAALESLLASSRWGLHLTEPWKVMLCGSPNVGKSSLINALLGYGRAIVFDRPGTTRDVLTSATAIDGWPVELSDTAGIRSSSDELESAGIARTRKALESADVVIPVLDASQPLTDGDRELLAMPGSDLAIMNKADLPLQCNGSEVAAFGKRPIVTSAVAGTGIAELLAAIASRLVPDPPAIEAAVLFTAEQVDAMRGAIEACRADDAAEAKAVIARLIERENQSRRDAGM